MTNKILVVDDDMALAKTVEHILHDAGYNRVQLAHTAEDGLRLAQSNLPDLMLLDVMVPTMGGWEVCRRLREFSSIPIIFLTALGQVDNIVRGLELGADDYLVKPFDEAEFLARIKASLRRAEIHQLSKKETAVIDNGVLFVDLSARLVKINNQVVDLTPREYDLFAVLVRRAGEVVPTVELVSQAWQMDDDDAVANVKPYIHYLRKKLETDPATPRWIQTVRGVGYRLTTEV